MTADGQQVPHIRRRRRKDGEVGPDGIQLGQPMPDVVDEEVSTFLQMKAEAEKLSHTNRECPVPKPKGVIGELLGFRDIHANAHHQSAALSEGDQ